MAMPNKLIAVDIFSSRVCVLILNSSWASSITKALETLEFQESADIKRRFYGSIFRRSQNFLDPGAVEYVVPSDPGESGVFRSYYYWQHI
jgi:hypothetical protein